MPQSKHPAPPGARPSALARLSSVAAAYVLTRVIGRSGGATGAGGAPGAAARTGRQGDRGQGDTSSPPDRSRRGNDATSPTEIPESGWWAIAKRVYAEIGNDRILAVAAGVTFYALLALFPAIAAFVSLYGLFADPATINDQLATLNGFLPSGAIEVVSDQVKRITGHGSSALGFAFFSGLAVSLWSANAGMKAIFDALNIAYDETERRNFFWLNLWSLGFTLGAIVFLGLAVSTVVVLPVVLGFVGLGSVGQWLITLGRWPAMFLIILGALAVLYRYGPNRARAEWRWVTPGSILAGLGWMAFSMLFSWYIGHFGTYNETYGSLGAVIGFMTWIWLSTTIVLAGAELNAEVEHQTAADTTEGPKKPLGERGATMADRVAPAGP